MPDASAPLLRPARRKNFPQAPTKNIKELLQNPKASVAELPVVYAAVGETAINDQTKTILAPANYELQTDTNGVAGVVYSDEITRIGQYVQMTREKVENNHAMGWGCLTFIILFPSGPAGLANHGTAPAQDADA